ncbi:MAG: hypothetical protein ACU0A6_00160, partial [Shimia sp.]|uniref:hypothetical protein n=1 Tax=Shimia sp. TaxID=1954381 RepID=UPI0040593BFF
MTDFATLAATQRRAYRTREAMLRQQHAQASMSGKSATMPSRASALNVRFQISDVKPISRSVTQRLQVFDLLSAQFHIFEIEPLKLLNACARVLCQPVNIHLALRVPEPRLQRKMSKRIRRSR